MLNELIGLIMAFLLIDIADDILSFDGFQGQIEVIFKGGFILSLCLFIVYFSISLERWKKFLQYARHHVTFVRDFLNVTTPIILSLAIYNAVLITASYLTQNISVYKIVLFCSLSTTWAIAHLFIEWKEGEKNLISENKIPKKNSASPNKSNKAGIYSSNKAKPKAVRRSIKKSKNKIR